MSSIGYNINLSAINNQAIEDASASQAPKHLIMTDSDDAARQVGVWKDSLGADKIVWRKYSKLEGNWSVYPTNDEIIQQWRTEGHRDIIRDDPTNEPSLDANNSELNRAYVDLRVDLLRRASADGFTVAVGAFSVGTPHEDMINAGIYDDLIRAVVEGGHYFSVHEYCPGIPGAGDVFEYTDLKHTHRVLDSMKPDLWPLDDYWLLRRSDRFVYRARVMGLADPRIIVTEAFIDNIDDARDTLSQLRDKYGMLVYNKDMRGVLTWRRYYAEVFPDKTYEEAVEYLTRYVAEKVFYPEYIKGVCLFALNNNWDRPEGHNYLNNSLTNFRRFSLPLINTTLDSPAPTPHPDIVPFPDLDDSLWQEGRFQFNGLNFRPQPHKTEGNQITYLQGAFEGRLHTGAGKEADGYHWVAIQLYDIEPGLASNGWVARYKHSSPQIDYFPFTETTPEPPPPQPTPPQNDTITLTKADARELATIALDDYRSAKRRFEFWSRKAGDPTVDVVDDAIYSTIAHFDTETLTISSSK